jgi:spore coat-associated protein N
MKKIMGLAISATLLIALVVGGTWAYFQDTETSTGNTIQAGTLDLGLSDETGKTPTGGLTTGVVSTPTNWAPGDTATISVFLYNSGTINMAKVTMELDLGTFVEGTPTSVDDYNATANTDKLEKMVKITAATFGGDSVAALVGKTLEDLDASLITTLGALNAGTEKELAITLTFDATATNGCQGDSYPFTMTFVGNQVAS